MNNHIVTGVDIGGTHITVCKVDLQRSGVLEETRCRCEINAFQDADTIISSWAKAIGNSAALGGYPVAPLGIAVPGPFHYGQGVSLIKGLHKYESLYGLNVKDMLAAALDIAPGHIRFMNDASAYLLGECTFARKLAEETVVGVTLGTGLGSAVYKKGQMTEGDLWCMPYGDGTAEDYLCSRWFVNELEARTGRRVPNVKDIAATVESDSAAKDLFKEFGNTLAKVLIIRYGKPDIFPSYVIIGGNIARSWDLFAPHCKATLGAEGFSDVCLLPAKLGENAALMGAACLWKVDG